MLELQLFKQHLHQRVVAGVAHGLVVEHAGLASQRFAQRAETARGVEGFVLGAVEREVLEPFERQHLDLVAVADRLAGVAVLVDQAVHAPGQVVLQRVGRKRRQRADAHLHVVERVELLRKVMRNDADETRRQAALRHEGGLRTFGQFHDRAGGGHVFGQVKVVATGLARLRGGHGGQVVRQRVDHRIIAAQCGQQRDGLLGVDHLGLHAEAGELGECRGALVDHRHLVVAAALQQAGDGLSDVAGAKQNDFHEVSPREVGSIGLSLETVAVETACHMRRK